MINEDLYNAFEALTIQFYNNLPPVGYTGSIGVFSKFFDPNDAIVLLWPEYIACSKILDGDQRITELLNKPLDDGVYSAGFSKVSSIIRYFIQNYLKKAHVYNETAFQNHYTFFEKFLYEHISYHIFTVRLYNFEDTSHRKDIIITQYLSLLYKPKEETSIEDTINGLSEYVLECIVPITFIIQGEKKKTVEGPYGTALKSINSFIQSVRLLKESNIYRDEYIDSQTSNPFGFDSSGFGQERTKPYLWTIKKTTLTDSEYDELKKVLEYLDFERKPTNQTLNNTFKVALTRFNYAIERENRDDKVIDFMIALEAMYLPDGNTELTFRLTLRVSLLLNERSVAKADFDFLKEMYKIRSRIVHGSSSIIPEDQIKRLESITRESLKAFIKDETQFSEENLNNLFFK